MTGRPRARRLAALTGTLLAAAACGHDWSASDGAADGDAPPVDADADGSRPEDVDDEAADHAPDLPPDAGPDTLPDGAPDTGPDSPPDVGPDTPPDLPPDTGPDTPPDDAPEVVDDVADDAPPEVSPTLVDLVVLAENTGSFTTERDHLQAAVSSLLDALSDAPLGWNVALGVAAFGDFPVAPYGTSGDVIFEVLQPVTTALDVALANVGAIADRNGSDMPDGAVVGLTLLATGAALEPHYAGGSCATPGPAVCFRPGATRIVLLFTDSPMHNGPPSGTTNPYDTSVLRLSDLPGWPAARAALLAERILVVGLSSGDDTVLDELTTVAQDTGAVVGVAPASFDLALDSSAVDLAFLVPVLEALVP